MKKSSRHSKITGNVGETLVLYWLSKRGFECAGVDHTGIDIIARRPASDGILGISVKCRSRNESRKGAHVGLLRKDDKKIREACQAFGCVPYVAIVADQGYFLRGFLAKLDHARSLSAGEGWLMSDGMIKRYKVDPSIEYFELANADGSWLANE